MVETAEQLEKAIGQAHFQGSGFASIGNEYYRVCSPEESDSGMYSCILWTKENAADTSPTWAKVVSYCELLSLSSVKAIFP